MKATRSLRAQLVALVVGCVLLASLVLGWLLIQRSRAFLTDHIFATSLATADLAAEYTARYMDVEEARIRELAGRPALVQAMSDGNPSQLPAMLGAFQDADANLAVVNVFDTDGRILASGSPALAPPDTPAPWMPELTTQKQPSLGLPARFTSTGDPVIPYRVPIVDNGGAVVGAVSAGISLSVLAETFSNLHVGPDARASITDRRQNGIILAHADKSRILQPSSGKNAATDQLLAGKRGTLTTTNSSGERDLAAFTQVPGLPWGVLLQQPEDDAFAPLASLTWQLIAAVAVIATLAALAAAWTAARVVGPIVQLREAAEALSSGDFSRRAGIHQANELGELGRTFDRMGESLERSLSSLQAEIEERQRAQEELAFEAMHDPLTGLPNRTLLTDRLSQAMAISQRSGNTLALLFMDLDGFKAVNDTYGHPCGDSLLCEIGQRLQTVLRASDTVARVGGDEFAAVLPGAGASDSAGIIARNVLKTMADPFEADGHVVHVGISIGLAFYPTHQAEADELIRAADMAMYAAKRRHSGYMIYSPRMEHLGESVEPVQALEVRPEEVR